jgi:hypothetical protein
MAHLARRLHSIFFAPPLIQICNPAGRIDDNRLSNGSTRCAGILFRPCRIAPRRQTDGTVQVANGPLGHLEARPLCGALSRSRGRGIGQNLVVVAHGIEIDHS